MAKNIVAFSELKRKRQQDFRDEAHALLDDLLSSRERLHNTARDYLEAVYDENGRPRLLHSEQQLQVALAYVADLQQRNAAAHALRTRLGL